MEQIESRSKRKQLLISPTARLNMLHYAKKADISANECVNRLTTYAIKYGFPVKRERKPEAKTCRLHFVTTPTHEKAIQKAAAALGVSFNEFVDYVLENYERFKI